MSVKNVISWNTMVDGYVQNRMVNKTIEVFDAMLERNVVSWNTMLTALVHCGRVEDARALFDKMPKRDVISWTTKVAGLAKNGRVDEARKIFDRMPERNVVSWNAMITGMITGFIQNGELKKAEKMFDKIPSEDGVKPKEGTFVSVLSACSDLAGIVEGQLLYQIIVKTVYHCSEIIVHAFINMYSKCGELSIARRIFDDGLISQRDLDS
ncbi:hypothetical protein REPUB_Repub06bG0110900 [Reevesia pubescens]